MPLEIGSRAPDFTLRNQFREEISLSDLKGSKVALVFIPFAFTGTCQSEMCDIRDNLHRFNESDIKVLAITCNTLHSNGVWAEQQGFQFDILSDFWPHGQTASAYGAFNEAVGAANRVTFLLDEEGVITGVISSDSLGVARDFAEYEKVLAGA